MTASLHEGRPERPAWHRLLACPDCHGDLDLDTTSWNCRRCGRMGLIVDNIPIFVAVELSDHDELDHDSAPHQPPSNGSDGHKAEQASFFDRPALAEFEIERPGGSPSFYRFLMTEKFSRATRSLGEHLEGWTALAVCGGSGMDAEFLRQAGASVISSDISLGAARRTLERARRHGLAISSIVADVERLPFRDHSVDLVYVHDGLHHLVDPSVGLIEMARVASQAVSITEPARAAMTNVAVRLGIALAREESGNAVARLDPASVRQHLRSAGFATIQAERYAMFYRHHPGRVFDLLSRGWLLTPATIAWRVANAVIGPVGNKVSIVAERRPSLALD